MPRAGGRTNPPAMPPGGGAPLTVLLVDDERAMRLLMRHVLEEAGHFDILAEAADGAEAIQFARDLQPDLVLLDLRMPRTDGHEALPHILESAPRARVVMLTAVDDDRTRARSLDLGAADHIPKATPPEDIVRRLLDAHAAGR